MHCENCPPCSDVFNPQFLHSYNISIVLTPVMLGPSSHLFQYCQMHFTCKYTLYIHTWLSSQTIKFYLSVTIPEQMGLFLEEMSILGSRTLPFSMIISRDPPPWHKGRHFSVFSKRHVHKTIPIILQFFPWQELSSYSI